MDIERYTPYVIQLARRYEEAGRRSGHELRDLIGAGFLGLCTAANKYDPNRGVQFVTYAHRFILGSILQQLRNSNSLVNISRNAWERGDPCSVIYGLWLCDCVTGGIEDQAVLRADLCRAMRHLTDLERNALVLTAVYGMSQAETGEKLGRSQMGVSHAISRARAKLRRELGGYSTEHPRHAQD